MAQANYITPSTSELDQREQMAAQFQEQMIASQAEQERRVAEARVQSVNIEVGTIRNDGTTQVSTDNNPNANYVLQPGERLIKTFSPPVKKPSSPPASGDTTSGFIATGMSDPHTIDVNKVTQSVASGQPTFDIDAELKKVKSIENLKDREDAAQLLYMNIGSQIATIQRNIRAQAAQRAGVNDAQASLDKNIMLDAAAMQTGRIRQGDTTIQTTNARATYQAALTAANQLETDLTKTDPMLLRLNMSLDILKREFGQIDRQQDKEKNTEDRLGIVLTDQRLTNAKMALGIPENNSAALHKQVSAALLKDKKLYDIIDAQKGDFPALLAHPDQHIRRYAYNMIANYERQNLGLKEGDPLPGYVTALEPLVANREAIFKPEDKKALTKESSDYMRASGENAKKAVLQNTIQQVITRELENTSKAKYQRMDMWTYPDNQFKIVIDSVKANNKDGKVLMSDGIDAIMRAKMVNKDGTPMSAIQKIEQLNSALGISMQNDKTSVILPSVENYYPQMASDLKNQAMRVYVRQQMPLPFPNPFINRDDIATGALKANDALEGLVKLGGAWKDAIVKTAKDITGGN